MDTDTTRATASEPDVAAPAPASSRVVEDWFEETFFNLGLDVELYNRFYAAKERLKVRLAALPKE